jgi:hypothetical protein
MAGVVRAGQGACVVGCWKVTLNPHTQNRRMRHPNSLDGPVGHPPVGRLAHSPSDKTEARRTWCPSRFSGVRRGASDAGESPWRQLRERAEEIPGDKKHDPGLRGFSHGVIALRCSIQHTTIEYSTEWIAVFISSDSGDVIKLPAAASRLGHPPSVFLEDKMRDVFSKDSDSYGNSGNSHPPVVSRHQLF